MASSSHGEATVVMLAFVFLRVRGGRDIGGVTIQAFSVGVEYFMSFIDMVSRLIQWWWIYVHHVLQCFKVRLIHTAVTKRSYVSGKYA